jgi:hypothetical protein
MMLGALPGAVEAGLVVELNADSCFVLSLFAAVDNICVGRRPVGSDLPVAALAKSRWKSSGPLFGGHYV